MSGNPSRPLTFGSLFTGIGGFDLALERAGFECRWQVEIDPACNRVLERHWPGVPRFRDVREVGARNLEPVDLVCRVPRIATISAILQWMKLTLAVKLAPDEAQHRALVETMERFNAACDWIAEVAFEQRTADKIRLQKIVYAEIRSRFGLSSQMAVRAISKVCEGYKRDRTIQPSFRAHGAIPYDQRIMTWKTLDRVSLLTLAGRVIVPYRFGEYQATRRDRIRGQADLVLRRNVFYLYCTVDAPEPPLGEFRDYLGVDLGIVNLAVDSDGTVHTGASVERRRRIHAHRRRNLQRRGSHSARRKLRRISGSQRRYQTDTNHIISKRVVAVAQRTGRAIAIEDLMGIRDRVRVKKRQRARHANWAFGQLRAFLTYKAQAAGVRLVLVDPRNTSRTCPECGCIDKRNRPARDRFVCIECGLAGPADAVAALNVRARAQVMEPMVPDGSQCAA